MIQRKNKRIVCRKYLQRSHKGPNQFAKEPADDNIASLNIKEATKFVGVGRTRLYEEIKAGRLRIKKCGRRTIILKSDLLEWLGSLTSSNEKVPTKTSSQEEAIIQALVEIGRNLGSSKYFAPVKDGRFHGRPQNWIGFSQKNENGTDELYLVSDWLHKVGELTVKSARQRFIDLARNHGFIEKSDTPEEKLPSTGLETIRRRACRVCAEKWRAWAHEYGQIP